MSSANSSGTKCPKCNNINFELITDFPTGSNFKFNYIRCSSCKVFLQAIPFIDTNTKIEQLQNDINKIKQKLVIF